MGNSKSQIYPYRYIDLDDCWIGPYGLIISNSISRIKDPDQVNFVLRPGNIKTNAPSNNTILSKDEYLKKYGTTFPNNRVHLILNDTILNEINTTIIKTKNKKGEGKIYKMMLDGSIFIETLYYNKTIYPINPITRQSIINNNFNC